jgi:CubicO group peptidase (beta-lactamase class C family)
MRRVDPRHRTLGRFFHDEVAAALGEDVYIGLPLEVPNSRLAVLAQPGRFALLLGFPLRLTLEGLNARSNIYRALVVNPGAAVYLDEQRVYARNLEVPSGNAVGTARGIAHAYGAFASGGRDLALRHETLELLAAPAVRPSRGSFDECMKADGVDFSLGFMKSCPPFPFGSAGAYGSPGAGGAMGFADPEMNIGYAYVTSKMGSTLTADPRDAALSHALYAAIGKQ